MQVAIWLYHSSIVTLQEDIFLIDTPYRTEIALFLLYVPPRTD